MDEKKEISQEVVVKNSLGVHTRPAAQLAQEAMKFESEIFLIMDHMVVNAKSVLDILTLGAAHGKKIIIKAVGRDADKAVNRLVNLFEEGFGEK